MGFPPSALRGRTIRPSPSSGEALRAFGSKTMSERDMRFIAVLTRRFTDGAWRDLLYSAAWLAFCLALVGLGVLFGRAMILGGCC